MDKIKENLQEENINIESKRDENTIEESPKIEEKIEDKIEEKDIIANNKNNSDMKSSENLELSNSKDELSSKIENIKQEINLVYKQYQNSLNNFENESISLAKQENEILNSTIKDSIDLLKSLKVDNLDNLNNEISEIKLDNKKEILNVKHPSKGKVKGLFWGTLTALISIAAIGAYGAKLANLPLNITTFMQKSNIDTIITKYFKLLHINLSIENGYILAVAIPLILGFIIYKIITFAQKFKNRKYVEHLEENAKEYKKELENKIEELQNIIEQIEKVKPINEKFDIILKEQNAKLNRILFLEKPESFDELHEKSKQEVVKTKELLEKILKLMNTPVIENNKLNEELINNLKETDEYINEIIKSLY